MISMRMVFWAALTVLLVACSDDGHLNIAVENTETITHYAHFRDPQHNRVVVFVFKEGTNAVEIKAHSQSLAHKEERLLAVYYFTEGSVRLPPTRLSRSGSIIRANDLMYDDADISPWQYAYLRPFAGEPRFTDCLAAPGDVLCRQKQGYDSSRQ